MCFAFLKGKFLFSSHPVIINVKALLLLDAPREWKKKIQPLRLFSTIKSFLPLGWRPSGKLYGYTLYYEPDLLKISKVDLAPAASMLQHVGALIQQVPFLLQQTVCNFDLVTLKIELAVVTKNKVTWNIWHISFLKVPKIYSKDLDSNSLHN